MPSLAQDDVFRVAAVAPSATNDLAFSQSMYDGLMAIQSAMGEDAFQFDFQDGTFIVDDAAVALREWAASGNYDLVIGHGSQFGSVVEELAAGILRSQLRLGHGRRTPSAWTMSSPIRLILIRAASSMAWWPAE